MKIAIISIIGIIIIGFGFFLLSMPKQPENTKPALTIKISAFKQNDFIPAKYTCDGDDINPMIEILNAPEETKSLALVMDDPDATRGVTWDHWILWNIDPKLHYIPEDSVPHGAVQGTTSFGHQKYNGPCPPRGNKPHRYTFKAYSLDTTLELPPTATKQDLEQAMAGHILESANFIGLYARKKNTQ